jgi:hypothetical protein
MQRGFVKRRVGRPEEALEDLKRALALDLKNREAHNHMGMALLDTSHLEQVCFDRTQLQKIDSACVRLLKLLSKQPSFPMLLSFQMFITTKLWSCFG